MTPTRARLATRLAVALGWLALMALLITATTSRAADPKPFCTSYKIKSNFCANPNPTKCSDWNGASSLPDCRVDKDTTREIELFKVTECIPIPGNLQGNYYWLYVCVDAVDNEGQPVREDCYKTYKCKQVAAPSETPPLKCARDAEVPPGNKKVAKTTSTDCTSPVPVWWWEEDDIPAN
jgi:hypothetical protein